MSNSPKRRWFFRLSPFHWFEAWLERLNQRQKEMTVESEQLRLQLVSFRAQAAEMRVEIERLQTESEALRASHIPLSPATTNAALFPAARRCPRGHTVPAAARFCPECGHVFPTRSGG